MKIIVVGNPFLSEILTSLFRGVDVPDLTGGVNVPDLTVEAPDKKPDLKADPFFYLKPQVPKAEVLRVRSNHDFTKSYRLSTDMHGNLYCTCKGFQYRGHCAHIDKIKSAWQSVSKTGLSLCLKCRNFKRDFFNFTEGKKECCKIPTVLTCPPRTKCDSFKDMYFMADAKAEAPKPKPVKFPVSGVLIQVFKSRTLPGVTYEVRENEGDLVCSCRGFNYNGHCKHVDYVRRNRTSSMMI